VTDPASEPRARRRWAKYAIIFGCWTLVGAFFATRPFIYALSDPEFTPKLAPVLIGNFADAYLWALLTPAVLGLGRRISFRKGHVASPLLIHIVAGILVALAVVTFNHQVATVLRPEESPSWAAYLGATIHWNIQWYWIIVGIAHAIDYYRRLRERELHESTLRAQLADAELQALKMQIQPHFLFNTLHAISELVHEDPDAADRMITRLGDLLRTSMDSGQAQEVPLEQELAFLRAYLDIEQTRFQDRLTVTFDIEPETLKAQVPNLLLQPLVENAIRHGISRQSGPGTIEVRSRATNGLLRLSVQDNGEGLPDRPPERVGVGIRNTRARLEQLYGAGHHFHLGNRREGGVIAAVAIPYREALRSDRRAQEPVYGT
jgi:signal transduction histidine kinase